jgi:hypothetical protein
MQFSDYDSPLKVEGKTRIQFDSANTVSSAYCGFLMKKHCCIDQYEMVLTEILGNRFGEN